VTLGSLLSFIEPSYTSSLSRLGDNISKSCTINLQYVSLNSFHIYSHFFFLIQAAIGQISFILDTWSHQCHRSFLAVTAYWVASVGGSLALQLKTALIAFHRLHKNYTGKSMARTVMHLLDRADIMVKVRQLSSYCN